MNKKYESLFGVYSIQDENSSYEFSANIDFKTGKFYMPALRFKNIQDEEYPNMELYWDNVFWLYNNFYSFLEDFLVDKRFKIEQIEKFKDIFECLDENECQILIDMLDKGRELGWHKL